MDVSSYRAFQILRPAFPRYLAGALAEPIITRVIYYRLSYEDNIVRVNTRVMRVCARVPVRDVGQLSEKRATIRTRRSSTILRL